MIFRLFRDRTAVLPIEFALIIPVMFALVLGIVDVSRVLLAHNLVGQLATDLSDHVRFDLGSESRTALSVASIRAELDMRAATFAGGLIDPEMLRLSMARYSDLAAFVNDTPEAGDPLPGQPNAVVSYRLDYTVPLMTPFAGFLYDSGDVTRTAVVVVKNGR
ncbi:TadE/TadG family type IV pilus assembly protein [Sneathiella sp.]|uniref:TadE/TadG family type IV pilus assembly protein n=1 Tax=Sneathiella sp. TaxID=1964365 RepID=UPI0035636F6C